MNAFPTSRWLLLLGLALAVVIVLLGRGCTSLSQPGAASDAARPTVKPAPVEPVIQPVPTPPPAPDSPPAVATTAAGGAPPSAGDLLSLTLQFKQDRWVEASREAVPQAAVRPLRQIEGMTGLYHRIVSPQGEVLFENVVPDPRRVPWDTTDDGKHLRGGTATLPDMPLMLRLPAQVHGRLEIYQITSSTWTRSTLDKTARLVGDLKL